MSNIKNGFKLLMRSIGLTIVLKLLMLISLVFPAYGNWVKRILTILVVFHGLQHKNLLNRPTLNTINSSMLKITKPEALTAASELANLASTRCNLGSCNIDSKLLDQHRIAIADAERISKEIIKAVPNELRYSEKLMTMDISRLITVKT